jgi:hypothetical protein
MTHCSRSVTPTNSIGNVMTSRLILVFCALCLSVAAADENTDSESEAPYQNAMILRNSFAKPLQLELLKRGLTPPNAETAAQNMLSSLIECWNSDRNEVPAEDQEIMTVQLGGQTIVTYRTPCMSEFLADVDAVTR